MKAITANADNPIQAIPGIVIEYPAILPVWGVVKKCSKITTPKKPHANRKIIITALKDSSSENITKIMFVYIYYFIGVGYSYSNPPYSLHIP